MSRVPNLGKCVRIQKSLHQKMLRFAPVQQDITPEQIEILIDTKYNTVNLQRATKLLIFHLTV